MTHPVLPAGYNSWEIDGDGVDGSGVNEHVSSVYFVTLTSLDPFLLDEGMIDIFVNGCPDYTVPRDLWLIVFPGEYEELDIRSVA